VTTAVKTFGPRPFAIKSAARGEVEAVFSTLGVVDKDGDLTQPGAFTDGAQVIISGYGHSSWAGQPPVGKGVIRTTAKDARLQGKFFLDTAAGRDTFTVVRELGAMQQWSYGFDVKETGELTPELRQLGVKRVLKSLKVHEVSPVLLGAGVDTRTVSAKCNGCGTARGRSCRCEERAAIDAAIRQLELDAKRLSMTPGERARWLDAFHAEHDVPPAVAVSREHHAAAAEWVAAAADAWQLETRPEVRFFKSTAPWEARGWFFDYVPGVIWLDVELRGLALVVTCQHETAHWARHQLGLKNDERTVQEDVVHMLRRCGFAG